MWRKSSSASSRGIERLTCVRLRVDETVDEVAAVFGRPGPRVLRFVGVAVLVSAIWLSLAGTGHASASGRPASTASKG